jgi:hypothetical protein
MHAVKRARWAWLAAGTVAALLPIAANAVALFTILPAAKSAGPPPLLESAVPIRMDVDAIASAQPGTTFDTTLPNGRVATVRIVRIERHENGDVSWVGSVADPGRDDLASVGTTGAHGTYAQIETADGTWGIAPSGQGFDWLFDKSATDPKLPPRARADDAAIPPYHPPAAVLKTTCPTVASMPATQVTVDVLAVLAPDFVANHGGAAGAETRLNNIFANMNAYNTASDIAIQYRRVATVNASYPAANAPGDDDAVALDAITAGTGAFANIAAVRDFYGADMVALFRGPKDASGNSISGIGWINGDANGNISSLDATHMYTVNGDWTYPDSTLPAHELGHNLGNNHDRPNASSSPSGTTSYAYGYFVCGAGAAAACGQPGFNDTGTGFGTIMAYEQPTVAKFASPNLMCQSTRSGALRAACGVDGQEDTVRATNCVRQSVAALRPSWVGTCPNLSADSDGDGIPDCLEAGSRRVNGTKDNDVFSVPLLFVAQQYRDFLAREADADGLNYWTGALTSRKATSNRTSSRAPSRRSRGSISPISCAFRTTRGSSTGSAGTRPA